MSLGQWHCYTMSGSTLNDLIFRHCKTLSHETTIRDVKRSCMQSFSGVYIFALIYYAVATYHAMSLRRAMQYANACHVRIYASLFRLNYNSLKEKKYFGWLDIQTFQDPSHEITARDVKSLSTLSFNGIYMFCS